jgi:hypothetical protein
MPFILLVEIWIALSAVASAAGWILSASGQLNRTGYAVFFGVTLICGWIFRAQLGWTAGQHRFNKRKFFQRFRRPLPAAFLVLAALVFLGSALHPPSTHTAMTYHIPRVLHWLAEERWHWIYTPVVRMNHSGCGMEWMSAPLILFTHSDRGIFLLNFFPLLLLPSLIYGVFIQLGVARRVAWFWMWLLPTGYNFLLQSSTPSNDTFAAVYALAMVYFGLRAQASGQPRDLWWCILAAGLLTGVKASNIPLVLPGAILVLASWRVLKRHWISAAFVLLFSALVSFVPSAVLNKLNCGDFLGTSIHKAHLEIHNPIIGIFGNAFQLLSNNFVPPFFVLAGWWNGHYAHLFPHSWLTTVENSFDTGFFWLGELPTEDWAGIGFGLSVLLVISFAAALARNPRVASRPIRTMPSSFRNLLLIAPWISLLAYCVKSGLVTAARLISPYYALLLPLLLLPAGHALIVRRRWWRALAWATVALAALVVIVEPGRPLWPAETVLSRAIAAHPNNRLLTRAEKVYSVYATRGDPLPQLRAMIPPEAKIVGFMGTADDIDISLWRPFGSRQVKHFFASDTAEQIRGRGIEYAVVSGLHLQQIGVPLETWLSKTGAQLLATTNGVVKVTDGPTPWYVVRFH